ncbi:DUF1700 domain-containing protein [Weissella halotolerans]|uniref:Membrane protein-like protein n=1 Tax=Weissella halotolerans DSM 20190 TaxID=1123500 RepID=A0A0R2G9E0_9LACO|nr:DUF1700 domain-containing protein [Weissella halotolerans]KRN33300.1 membrane protein-like protein [Weissella halotolerans DSM 20190]
MFDDYLAQVRNHLNGIPTADQDDMLRFYDEQFMDAGYSLDEVVQKYGTPKQFARTLRLEYMMNLDDEAKRAATEPQSRTRTRGNILLLIVLCLFASPVLIPVAIGLIIVILVALMLFFMMIFGIYAAIIMTLAGGVFALINGLLLLGQSIPTGLFFIGTGFALTGLTLIGGPIIWNLTKWLFEVFMQGIKWIGRRFITHRTQQSLRSAADLGEE